MKWIDWVGHYKNILSVELCNQIIDHKFNYVKSTYSTHKGLSPNEKRVEMDEIWIRKDNIFYNNLKDAVSEVAKKYSLPCQISLEEYMACAIGGCAGCTIPIKTEDGIAMKRVCVDGPVFNANNVF